MLFIVKGFDTTTCLDHLNAQFFAPGCGICYCLCHVIRNRNIKRDMVLKVDPGQSYSFYIQYLSVILVLKTILVLIFTLIFILNFNSYSILILFTSFNLVLYFIYNYRYHFSFYSYFILQN